MPPALTLNEFDTKFDDFVDRTHHFLEARPLLLANNTPHAVVELFRAEVDELIEALAVPEDRASEAVSLDVIGEVGDVIHFFNDLMRLLSYQPQELVLKNGKPLETVADYRHRAEQLTVPEVKELSDFELLDVLKEKAAQLLLVLANDVSLLEMPQPLDPGQEVVVLVERAKQIAEREKLLTEMLQLIFLISDRVQVDLVFAGTLKNRRNEKKYPARYFRQAPEGLEQQEIDALYKKARDKSKQQWLRQGGDQPFFEGFMSRYVSPVQPALSQAAD